MIKECSTCKYWLSKNGKRGICTSPISTHRRNLGWVVPPKQPYDYCDDWSQKGFVEEGDSIKQ